MLFRSLWAGVGGAADLILVPERPMPWDEATNILVANKLRGKLTSIVLIAEGAGSAEDFCEYVRAHSDVEIKATVLGYIQRGGNPSAFDRVLAAKLGQRAVELLADGQSGFAVGIKHNDIINVPLLDAVKVNDTFDDKLYDLNTIMAKF